MTVLRMHGLEPITATSFKIKGTLEPNLESLSFSLCDHALWNILTPLSLIPPTSTSLRKLPTLLTTNPTTTAFRARSQSLNTVRVEVP